MHLIVRLFGREVISISTKPEPDEDRYEDRTGTFVGFAPPRKDFGPGEDWEL